MPTRGLLVLAAVTAATVVASWIAVDARYRETVLEARGGEPVFPELRDHIGRIAEIGIGWAGGGFALERRGDGWANTGLGGYPARTEMIEAVLSDIVGLRYLEPKTARAALYPRLAVEDPEPGAGSTRLTLRDEDGDILADLIVGKAGVRTTGADRASVYMRLPGRERAWLAEGTLDVHRGAGDWSDRAIVDIDARSVRSLTVRHADGEVVDLHRAGPDDRKLTLRNLPAGAAVAHQHHIDYMAGLLAGLSFDDARAGGPSAPAVTSGFEATVETFDHLRVTLRTGRPADDGSLWAAVDAGLADAAGASDHARAEASRIASELDGWLVKLPRRISDRLDIRLHDIIRTGSTGAGRES
ncbi:MAG: DUF4340 domain-containing protein [Thiotrichales bacterium]|nr:DUF4340 domain-containing protein [Thiotrichales bacterium]